MSRRTRRKRRSSRELCSSCRREREATCEGCGRQVMGRDETFTEREADKILDLGYWLDDHFQDIIDLYERTGSMAVNPGGQRKGWATNTGVVQFKTRDITEEDSVTFLFGIAR